MAVKNVPDILNLPLSCLANDPVKGREKEFDYVLSAV